MYSFVNLSPCQTQHALYVEAMQLWLTQMKNIHTSKQNVFNDDIIISSLTY